MAIEADYYKYQEEETVEELSLKITPGTYKKFDYLTPTKVSVFLNATNKRGLVEIDNKENLYAIKFIDDADEEGEIVDLVNFNQIELKPGEEVKIRKYDEDVTRDLYLYLDESTNELIINPISIPQPEYSLT